MNSDRLIYARERLLQRLFRIPVGEVLNPDPASTPSGKAVELANLLMQTANQMKAEAIDDENGQVDYKRLRQTSAYKQYVGELIPQLHHLDLNDLRDNQAATSFWINLYNTLTLHAVIEFGITESIASGGFGGHVRFFRRAAYMVGGMRFSLENIEHGVLRGNAGNPIQVSRQFAPDDKRMACVISPVDPRIHFALNCASNSCPPIGFYDPGRLNQQLDLASENFIRNETVLYQDRLHISKLFRWYRKDFGGDVPIVDFLLRYLPDDERRQWLTLHRSRPKFHYLPYDWGLNKLK